MYSLAALGLLIISIRLFFRNSPQIGSGSAIPEPENSESLDYYRKGRFGNLWPTNLAPVKVNLIFKFLFSRGERYPTQPIPNHKLDKNEYANSSSKPIFTWFGHSSLLLRLNDQNILIDPVFSARASMFPFIGPKAFEMDNPFELGDLPNIDILLLTHDHYDHLDYKVIKKIAPKATHIITTYGVGQHLIGWGIDQNKITELLWWQNYSISDIEFTSLPMQHFSGRGLTDRHSTLWGGFAIKSADHNVFFNADSGYNDTFKEIGEKLGPFDLAFMECGQYNEAWHDIHMMPEETALAAVDIQAKAVVPIHWGKFALSLHPWQEPVTRFLKASADKEFKVGFPEIGATYPLEDIPQSKWWRDIV